MTTEGYDPDANPSIQFAALVFLAGGLGLLAIGAAIGWVAWRLFWSSG